MPDGKVGLFLLILPLLTHCSQPKERNVPPPSVSQVLERYTGRLMSLRGVVGTAEGKTTLLNCCHFDAPNDDTRTSFSGSACLKAL